MECHYCRLECEMRVAAALGIVDSSAAASVPCDDQCGGCDARADAGAEDKVAKPHGTVMGNITNQRPQLSVLPAAVSAASSSLDKQRGGYTGSSKQPSAVPSRVSTPSSSFTVTTSASGSILLSRSAQSLHSSGSARPQPTGTPQHRSSPLQFEDIAAALADIERNMVPRYNDWSRGSSARTGSKGSAPMPMSLDQHRLFSSWISMPGAPQPLTRAASCVSPSC